MTSYLVPAGEGAGEYTEKRSRFLGRVWPVETEAEALARIEATRKTHYDARHNVFAYHVRSGGIVRYSDDGEPQGTGGQPILGVLQGAKLENFCCVVTRYFGGILLGTGGLSRAYAAAAKAALEDAGIARMALWHTVLIPCDYPRFERVKRLLEQHEAIVEGVDYGADVRITALLPEDRAEAFAEALRERSAGALSPEKLGEQFRAVPLDSGVASG